MSPDFLPPDAQHNHDPSASSLDPTLKAILDGDIRRGKHSDYVAGQISETLETLESAAAPQETNYVAGQMAAMIEYLESTDSEVRPGVYENQIPASPGGLRILSVFDQLIAFPGQTEPFLNDPRVTLSQAVNSKLDIIAVREWNLGADITTTASLVKFVATQAEDSESTVSWFIGSMVNSDRRGRELDELLSLLPNILSPNISMQIMYELASAQEVIKERYQAAETARKAQERARMLEEAKKAKQQREAARKTAWLEAIKTNPEDIYAYYLETDFAADYLQDDTRTNRLAADMASRYILATDGKGNHVANAENVLLETLAVLVESEDLYTGRLKGSLDYKLVAPHLARLIPNSASFAEFVQQHPALIEKGEFFYDDWKDAYIDAKLRQKQEALIGDINTASLKEQDIASLEITLEYFGIPYDNIDAIEADLRRYYVDSIADAAQVEVEPATEMTGSAGIGKIAISDDYERSDYERNDEYILQTDIIEPFKQWLEELPNYASHGAYQVFKSVEAKYKGRAYGHLTTRFAGHGISIGVDTSGEQPKFYLNVERMGYYAQDAFPAEQLERFAAFVGKKVAYKDDQHLRITPNLIPPRADPETLAQKEAELRANGQPYTIESKGNQRGGHKKWQRESWKLPHGKTPNGTLAGILRQVMGMRAPIQYPTTRNYEPDSLVEPDATLQEMQLVFEHFKVLDRYDKKEPNYLHIESIAQFVIPHATAKQAEKLQAVALAYQQYLNRTLWL
ncbi:MAG TPA: hypothetical protein VLG16_04385 [Candidatus Saccharimonadales bacterium]|nr:hypothetical protein [Candidatus Saccharimonadales bacterium]